MSPGPRRLLFSRGAPGHRSHAGALGSAALPSAFLEDGAGGGAEVGAENPKPTPPNNKQLLKSREAHARQLPSPGAQNQPMSLRLPSPGLRPPSPPDSGERSGAERGRDRLSGAGGGGGSAAGSGSYSGARAPSLPEPGAHWPRAPASPGGRRAENVPRAPPPPFRRAQRAPIGSAAAPTAGSAPRLPPGPSTPRSCL